MIYTFKISFQVWSNTNERERERVNERESINGIILAAHSGINFHKNNSEY